jgi:hypothetical protein
MPKLSVARKRDIRVLTFLPPPQLQPFADR